MARKGINDIEQKQKVSNILFQSTTPTEVEEKKEELFRQTYFLDETIIEAIRIFSFQETKQKSVLVRELLEKAIPVEIYNQAVSNVEQDIHHKVKRPKK